MSIWPRWHHGRVCIPWWYGLGWTAWVVLIVSIGMKERDTMDVYLSTESIIALVVCAFVGSLAYVLFYAISNYEKQKSDAEEVRNSVAASGRDPTDENQLTAREKWEIAKAQHFDRIFIIADILAVLIGTGLGVAFVYLFGGAYVEDAFVKYGVLGFIAGLVATLVINETLVKNAAKGEWEKKSAAAFRIVKAVAEDAVEAKGGLDALIQKYIDAGLSKREAREMAKQKLIEDPDVLDKL